MRTIRCSNDQEKTASLLPWIIRPCRPPSQKPVTLEDHLQNVPPKSELLWRSLYQALPHTRSSDRTSDKTPARSTPVLWRRGNRSPPPQRTHGSPLACPVCGGVTPRCFNCLRLAETTVRNIHDLAHDQQQADPCPLATWTPRLSGLVSGPAEHHAASLMIRRGNHVPAES